MKIVFTSDVHSYLYPTDYVQAQNLNMGALCIASSYQKDADTLVIDAGDFLQGSPFSKYVEDNKIYHPFPQAVAAQKMGLDIFVPGNHDFNFGYEVFKEFCKQSGAQILCANLEDTTGEIPIVRHLIVTDSTGLRIGFTGAITEGLKLWEKPENLASFRLMDVREEVEKELSYLKEHADVTVLVYHGGFECDLDTGNRFSTTRENIGYELATELDFDLLLTGHQHLAIDLRKVGNSYVLQTPSFATQYGELQVTRAGISGGLQKPQASTCSLDTYFLDLKKSMDFWLDSPIGILEEPVPELSQLESLSKGNHFADLVNQIQLDVSGADISATALANVLHPLTEEVSIRQVLASYQYPNNLSVIEVGEGELRTALETCATFFTLEDGKLAIASNVLQPKVSYFNYDYYYGIEYEFDVSKPEGERVVKLLFQGSPIGDRKLKLVINGYRRTGAGGYAVLADSPLLDKLEVDVQNLLIEFFVSHAGRKVSWPKADFRTFGYQ